MLIFRLAVAALALLLITNAGAYVYTRNRRYLELSWKIMWFAVMLLLVFGLLYVLERYALAGWGLLL